MIRESSERSFRVLLVEDNPGDRRLIENVLLAAPSPSFQVDSCDRLSAAGLRIAAGGVDVVLLDLSLPDSDGLETFARLHREFPDVPIVVMTGHADEELAFKAVNAGAQDYLRKGSVDPRDLIRSLGFAIERQRGRPPQNRPAGHVVAVVGPKGGSGKTMLSINLAAAFAELGAQNVALLDLDLEFGDAGLLFASGGAPASQNAHGTRHGFQVISSATEPVLNDSPGADQLESLVRSLRQRVSYLVIDTASHLDSNSAAALRLADSVVLVVEPYTTAVHHAGTMLGVLERWGVSSDRILIVLNRVGAEESLFHEHVEKQLRATIAEVIPSQPVAALRTTEHGMPVTKGAPESRIAGHVRHLARLIAGTALDQNRPGGTGTAIA